MFMLTLGSVVVAMQAKWTLWKGPSTFTKYNTALYKIFVNELSAQCAVSLKC